eukprot:11141925-Alexandrium_andersonii.AAC.1
MSASLVGSEMCIRDRPWTPQASADFIGRNTWTVASVPDQRELGAQHPVSYTHLTLPTICSV